MIRSPSCVVALYERFAENPTSDSLAFLFFFGSAFFMARLAQNRFHMNPVTVCVKDDQLAPAACLAQFGGLRAGSDAEGFFVHQRSTLGLRDGERGGKEDGYGDRNRGNR